MPTPSSSSTSTSVDEVEVGPADQEITDRVVKAAAPEASQPASLNDVLPGTWQVQIQGAGGTGQMQLEVFPKTQFRGQLMAPMGMTSVTGTGMPTAAQQIALQGRQSNGFQVVPYAAMLQVTFFDPQQIRGVSNVGEQVTWQRIG